MAQCKYTNRERTKKHTLALIVRRINNYMYLRLKLLQYLGGKTHK